MIKKTISLILVLSLFLIILPLSALPAGAVVSGSFSYEVLQDGTAEITGYSGSDFILEIPSVIDGYTVTSIGDEAFFENRNYKKVIIPDTVTKIGRLAFGGLDYNCRLQFVEIPDSVTTIGGMAFLNCQNVQSIRIPESVTYIGDYALGSYYYYRESLEKYVYVVDDSGFFNIYCQPDSEAYDYAVFYDIAYKLGPTQSGDYLYSVLPDGTAEITEYLGEDAEVDIPSVIDGYTVTTIGRFAFSETEIEQAVIPDTVKLIDACAFYECPYLWDVVIPEGVETISDEAFENCPVLYQVTVPRSVTSIGVNAFGYTFDERNITFTLNEGGMTLCGYMKSADEKSAAEEYAYANGLTFDLITVEYGDFNYAVMDDGTAAITNYIGNAADLYIPEKMDGYTVTYLDSTSFMLSKSLKSVHIPSGVIEIGMMAFYGCTNLEDVFLPDSLVFIDGLCFLNCYSLHRLYLPRTLVYSMDYAYGYNFNQNNELVVNEDFCAVVYEGRGPQRYCEQSNVKYTHYLYGDADCDGDVSVIDVTMIQRKLGGLHVPERFNSYCAAVVNGSGNLSILDATVIQRYDAQMAVSYPVGEPVPLFD